MKKTAVLVTVILLIQTGIYSQTMEVGLFGGTSYYNGDLNPGLPFQKLQPVGGVLARYNFDTRWSARISGIVGKIASADRVTTPKIDTAVFNRGISELALVGEFNFYPYVNGSSRNYLSPYIFGGIGYFHSTNDINGLSIPFGLGIKYSASQKIGFAFEWGMRKTFTDNMDKNANNLPASKINPKTMDWFNFVGISITVEFDIFDRSTCVDFTNGYRK